jgi:glycosyltransferase involved in cell wall biosynthesis
MDLGIIFRKEGVNESIPVCLFEFAACGIPCCCSDIGIMADFVKEHQIGYVAKDSTGFCEILDLVHRESFSGRASQLHATAENHFSLAHTRKLFARLISDNLTPPGDIDESNYSDPVLQ